MSNNDSLSIINGLQIKKLDDIKTDDYLAFPTQDVDSEYLVGNEKISFDPRENDIYFESEG